MKAFPRGQYDDQVAATILGLEYIFPVREVNYGYTAEVTYSGWNY